jgi:Tfp pilus assembly protein PilX
MIMETVKSITEGSKHRQQKGAVTLAMSLILLFLITLVTLGVTRNISIEKKFSNNDVRSSLAFEAAEAGVAAAFGYLENRVVVGSGIQFDDYTVNGTAQPSPFYNADYDGDRAYRGVLDTGSYVVRIFGVADDPDDPLVSSETVMSDQSFKIVSTGFSDDLSATRTISLIASRNKALEEIAGNPLIAKGLVNSGGSFTVINPEGDTTIWSGDDVDLSSGNGTETEIPNPFDTGYPECMSTPLLCDTVDTSNKTLGAGPDVIEYDTNLSNLSTAELFEKYFGSNDIDAYAESDEVTLDTSAGDPQINGLTESVIVLSDPSGVVSIPANTFIGCPNKPAANKACPEVDPAVNPNPDEWPSIASIVIINGDLEFNGNIHISGLLFVNGRVIDGNGNLSVYGAMITGGVSNDVSGSIDITYHSGLLAQASLLGPSYAPPGGWRDF